MAGYDLEINIKHEYFNDAKSEVLLEQNILNWIRGHPPITSESLQ